MLSPLQGFTLQFWDCVRRMIPKTVSVKWAWVTELSLWFALSPDSSLVPWEKALLSLGRSSTHMHQTAVDFTALFRLLQPKKKVYSWTMTYFYLFTHFFTEMWKLIFCLIQPPAILSRRDFHCNSHRTWSVQPCSSWGKWHKRQKWFLSAAELKGFRQQRENKEPLPQFFPLAQFHITQLQAFAWDVWDRNLVRLYSLYGQRTGRNASREWFGS